jgi:hypothetical protein
MNIADVIAAVFLKIVLLLYMSLLFCASQRLTGVFSANIFHGDLVLIFFEALLIYNFRTLASNFYVKILLWGFNMHDMNRSRPTGQPNRHHLV